MSLDSSIHCRQWLKDHHHDGIFIPHGDEWFHEFPPSCEQILKSLTNFSGSAGMAIVTQNDALLFTDGRYLLQAAKELAETSFVLASIPLEEWLTDHLTEQTVWIYDPWRHDAATIARWRQLFKQKNAVLMPITPHPFSKSPKNEPPPQKIIAHPLSAAGISSDEKLNHLSSFLQENQWDYVFVSDSASVSWLFNLRGNRVPYSPVVLARALVRQDGTGLFLCDEDVTPLLPSSIPQIDAWQDLIPHCKGKKIALSPHTIPQFLHDALEGVAASVTHIDDPCLHRRAIKNKAEIEGARAGHLKDGIALFYFWHDVHYQTGENWTEHHLAEHLLSWRKKEPSFRGASFPTIAAVGENAAIIHYHPTPQNERQWQKGELLLLDSGGHYDAATTDITRVFLNSTNSTNISKVKALYKKHYTWVLKAQLAALHALFPPDTPASQIDGLARAVLWKEHLNYNHGTGHGVGSCLTVHEGPIALSPRCHDPLKEGMILSIEPALYQENSHGIRLENLVLVQKRGVMLGFECLTLLPYEPHLIDADLLTSLERQQLNDYHAHVQKMLNPHLTPRQKDFLALLATPL